VTSVWPVLSVVVAAGVFYLYSLILRHLAKTTVRNKVVLITDSLSTLGNGAILFQNNWIIPVMQYLKTNMSLL